MSKAKLPVAAHLTDEEYHYFLTTYALHNSSMGIQQRVMYLLGDVIKIERGDNCLHVHYADGKWWHYTPDGTWC